jgi:hypothetical protein
MSEDDLYDTTERVDEYENGVRLHIRSKRGSGTRDEDKVSGELHADSIEELEAKRAALREQVVTTLRELREHQPDKRILTADEQAELKADLWQVLDEVSDESREAKETLESAIEELSVED